MKYLLLLFWCVTTVSCISTAGFKKVENSDEIVLTQDDTLKGSRFFSENNFIFFRGISGSVDSCVIDSVTVLVFLKEPSCTGCKEQLAEYFLSKESYYKIIVVLPFGVGNFYRKTEIARAHSIFPNAKRVVFSLSSEDTLSVEIDGNYEKIVGGGFPKIIMVSEIDSETIVTKPEYKWLFHDTQLNIEGLDSLLGN